jgi:hypothetical protein
MHVHPTVVLAQPEQYLMASLTKPTPPHLPQMAGSVSWRVSILGTSYLQRSERAIGIYASALTVC